MGRNISVNNEERPFVENNILKSIYLSGRARTTDWHYKKASKGHIYGITNLDKAKDYAMRIDNLITVLNEHFKDNWDIHFKFNRQELDDGRVVKAYVPYVIIRYKSLTLTNQNESEHTIQDLIVHINFSIDCEYSEFFRMSYLKGTRLTMSYEEWFVGYMHSHLTEVKPTHKTEALCTTDFCLGEDSEIDNIRRELRNDFDIDLLRQFFFALDGLLQYESLEGTPYTYLENISIGSETVPASLDNSLMRVFYRGIRRTFNKDNFDLDFVFSDGHYKIKQNNKLSDLCKKSIIKYQKSSENENVFRNCLVMRSGTSYFGYSFPILKTKEELASMFTRETRMRHHIRNESHIAPYLIIQGEKFSFEIKEYTGEVQDINKFNTHPKFLNYVSEKLEQELFKKTIIKSTIEATN